MLPAHVLQGEELAQLEQDQKKLKMKNGPCEGAVEPVLQRNNIQRQKYFGGAFIGNHIHHALQRQTTHAITHCHLDLEYRCPDLLPDALVVAEGYSRLMTLYSDCRQIFSSSNRVTASDLQDLQERVTSFMAVARCEVVERSRGNVTPKLHLLEKHVVPSIRRFGGGLGLLGEQGGESIHAEFNSLSRTFSSVVRELDRLAMVVKQHCLSSLPQQLAKVPKVRPRK